jgi:hypothetical protein
MTRYSIDTHGVSCERLALSNDPSELSACASAVASAGAFASSAVWREGDGLGIAHERFSSEHVHALDALADAASALGDRLDRSTLEARSVELFVTSCLAAVAASDQAAPGDPSGPGPR